MKRTAMLLLTVGGFLLAACSTGYEKRMQAAYLGKPADGFLARAGKPDRTRVNSDGSRVMNWENRREIDGFYGPVVTYCDVTLTVTSEGLISGYSARGPDCRT